MSTGVIVGLGEIMLRLKPPGYERLLQSPQFEATFGGGEANTILALAEWGLPTRFITALPPNPLGEACLRWMQSFGVDTSPVARRGERLGLYFFEAGANQRPSLVIYDRADSAIATASVADFDFEAAFTGASWFHITGITPAISQQGADLAIHAVRLAKTLGLRVSCDFSYRSKLWNFGKSAQEVMADILPSVDLLIANEEDCRLSLGIEVSGARSERERLAALAARVFVAYPNLSYQGITLREGISASHNAWSACLYNGRHLLSAARYDIPSMVDRVGSGDAFGAGLLYGLSTGLNDQETLDFATAAACLKHSIPGDLNLVTAEEVRQLLAGEQAGRVRR